MGIRLLLDREYRTLSREFDNFKLFREEVISSFYDEETEN